MSQRKIIIGTRGSRLALWQAHFVQDQLTKLGHSVELKIIKTSGDKIQNIGFDKMEGKGFFTKEIEQALLSKEIDLAVHSHKDLETTSPPGLVVAAVSDREDPRELLMAHTSALDPNQTFGLKKGAVVGTSSARRKSQLLGERPDIELKDLRGNVPTRIDKLRQGGYDAILLAAAGVKRLELDISDLAVQWLDPKSFIPAPAQGVMAFQIREDDVELAEWLKPMHHQATSDRIEVERSVLREFHGGCQVPLGAYCEIGEQGVDLWVAASESWQDAPLRLHLQANTAEGLAAQAVAQLKKKPGQASS